MSVNRILPEVCDYILFQSSPSVRLRVSADELRISILLGLWKRLEARSSGGVPVCAPVDWGCVRDPKAPRPQNSNTLKPQKGKLGLPVHLNCGLAMGPLSMHKAQA